MNKNLPLESLRGIAAIAVVLYHFRFPSPLVDNLFIRNAHVMVDFFFVLSGYVIALSYQHRINVFGDVVTFQKKRFWRLYPLHLVTLMLFVLQDVLKAAAIFVTGTQTSTPPFSGSYLENLVHNLFLTHAIFLDNVTCNWPSWSISTEFYTYIIFAVLIFVIRKQRGLCYLLVAITSGLILHEYGNGLNETTGLGLLRCTYSFFLGALAFEIIGKNSIRIGSILPAILLGSSVVSTMYFTHNHYELFIPLLFTVTIATVVKLKDQARLKQILSTPVLVYLGTISYSVYLTHSIVHINLKRVLQAGFNIYLVEQSDGTTQWNLTAFEGTIVILAGLVVVIGISHLSYRFIEDRFRYGLQKKQQPQNSPAKANV